MAELFNTTKQNISLHINNIFEENELNSDSVVKENLTTAQDGKKYKTKYYSLDWRKILDIYATSIDYNAKDEKTREFFKTVQNKMHYAVHKNTAAEVIFNRVDSEKENIGLTHANKSRNRNS